MKLWRNLFSRPAASLLLVIAAIGLLYSLGSILTGTRYAAPLNWVDMSTVLFISLLLGRGAYAFRAEPPLKAISLCLLNVFSFIYCFESVYKFLFFGWLHQPAELRDLLLQAAATLTILLGFHYRDFVLTRRSMVFAALYLATMGAWLSFGYPQLFMGRVYPAWLDIAVTPPAVYVINRVAKGFLFLAYFFLYTSHPLDTGSGRAESHTHSL
jgi:hypothetical protein